jgi:putative transposase
VKLRYNERIYPTTEQKHALARFFGCARVVYNDGLRARQAAWKNGEPYISDVSLQKMVITAAKKT